MDPSHLPPPAFEGSEKRLEVDFYSPAGDADGSGLRALPRSVLDDLMEQVRRGRERREGSGSVTPRFLARSGPSPRACVFFFSRGLGGP